jgi:hypothetical protein
MALKLHGVQILPVMMFEVGVQDPKLLCVVVLNAFDSLKVGVGGELLIRLWCPAHAGIGVGITHDVPASDKVSTGRIAHARPGYPTCVWRIPN